jgi:hypothetical protein
LEAWLIRRFLLKQGPAMLQRTGYWQYLDGYGAIWALYPTQDRLVPLRMVLEQEGPGIG